jgi:hypothetical protein
VLASMSVAREGHLLPLSEHVLHMYLNRHKPAAPPAGLLKLKHATLLRLYSGSIQALFRFYEVTIKAL